MSAGRCSVARNPGSAQICGEHRADAEPGQNHHESEDRKNDFLLGFQPPDSEKQIAHSSLTSCLPGGPSPALKTGN